MALSLSLAQLAQLEAANRALLSPLAAPDPRRWLLEAGRAVCDLLGGERLLVMDPAETGRYHSEDAPEVVEGVADYVESVSAGGIVYSDPVVRTWYQQRMAQGREVLTWDESRHLVEANGHRMLDSPIVADVLCGHRLNDFAVLVRQVPEGDAMIWVLHRQHEGFAFGAHAGVVMGTLLPAFRAGLDALSRFAAHRHALDHVTEPLAAFDADAQPLYRNAAVTRLLDADPERARVEAALQALALRLRALAFPRRGGPTAAPETAAALETETEVTTARGRYTLRGLLLPHDGGFGEAFLVSVTHDAPPAMPPPEVLRARLGLTRREGEVALLVAEGLTNAALAERLFISGHTARHHVESVMGKLAVTSRAAVAAKLIGTA